MSSRKRRLGGKKLTGNRMPPDRDLPADTSREVAPVVLSPDTPASERPAPERSAPPRRSARRQWLFRVVAVTVVPAILLAPGSRPAPFRLRLSDLVLRQTAGPARVHHESAVRLAVLPPGHRPVPRSANCRRRRPTTPIAFSSWGVQRRWARRNRPSPLDACSRSCSASGIPARNSRWSMRQ